MTDVVALSRRDSSDFGIEMISEELNLTVDIQIALVDKHDRTKPPSDNQIGQWAERAYSHVAEQQGMPQHNEVTIRLVERQEITSLNRDYRSKDQVTNVLSFPFDVPHGLEMVLLGDIVICHDVVISEAEQENKSLHQHYAHMVTHGVLHLCGFDHQCDESADRMEALEANILAMSDLPNPYLK